MKSQVDGKSTLDLEVLNISKHGFWLYVNGHEYFLPFRDFPWFKDSTISAILNVSLLSENHLYWQDLDVDLKVDCLERPEKYPLIYAA